MQTTAGVLPTTLTDLAHDMTVGTTGAFFTFDQNTDRFGELKAVEEEGAGGIIADSVDRLILGTEGDYSGRFVTTGNTYRFVLAQDDFFGALISDGDITRFVQSAGVFGGVLDAAGDIVVADIIGPITSDARITAGRMLNSLLQRTGDFGGLVEAQYANAIRVIGSVLSSGQIDVDRNLITFFARDTFAGSLNAGELIGKATVLGAVLSGGSVTVADDANVLEFLGGFNDGATATVNNNLNVLVSRVTHAGVIAVRNRLNVGVFDDISVGILAVANGGGRIDVRGNVLDSVISYGVDIGDDGIYNTADDLIYGGILDLALFRRDFIDSVLAIGVLPNIGAGSGLPNDNRSFLLLEDVDSQITGDIDAGGLALSTVRRFIVSGEIVSSNVSRRSVLAAADGVGIVTVRDGLFDLTIQENPDAFGPPIAGTSELVSSTLIRVTFNERLDPDTLIVLDALNPDTALTYTLSVFDITDFDPNDPTSFPILISGITLTYDEQTNGDGSRVGIINLEHPIGFPTLGNFLGCLQQLDNRLTDNDADRTILTTLPGGNPTGRELSNQGLDLTDF